MCNLGETRDAANAHHHVVPPLHLCVPLGILTGEWFEFHSILRGKREAFWLVVGLHGQTEVLPQRAGDTVPTARPNRVVRMNTLLENRQGKLLGGAY